MPPSAPRISHRLLRRLEQLDDHRVPIAETYRRFASEAERLGLTRPSYEQVRTLVHRWRKLNSRPTTSEILVDIAFLKRVPDELIDHLAGDTVRKVRR
jgi:hypothetical protein